MSSTPQYPQRRAFTATAKWLHWVMAAIWLVVWVAGYAAVTWREAVNPEHGLTIAHKALASTLLFLIVVRVLWRLTHPAPSLPDSMGPLSQRLAHLGHIALYAGALIALPLSGWMWSSVADQPIMLLWLVQVPPLVAPNPDYYDLAKLVHVTLAWSMGALVLGHLLLALKHRFADRDGVMESMLPSLRHTPERE